MDLGLIRFFVCGRLLPGQNIEKFIIFFPIFDLSYRVRATRLRLPRLQWPAPDEVRRFLDPVFYPWVKTLGGVVGKILGVH